MVHSEEEHDFLFKVAQSYYLDGNTQEQIGLRYGISRVKVSRLLRKARELQIVQITVSPPGKSLADLEMRLAAQFRLDEVVIARSSLMDGPVLLEALARVAAPVLLRHVGERSTLAVSWGRALSALVDALPPHGFPRVTVVQMLGGLGRPEAETHGADIARRLAEALGASPRLLPSPGIVVSRHVCDALLGDAQVYDTLGLAARADIALVGIGVPSDSSLTLREGNILSQAELASIKERGGVGDISLRFFDRNGVPIVTQLDSRIVGLQMSQIQAIPRVIGVAGGMAKLSAIRAALKGGLVDVLVTDVFVARRLWEEIEMEQL